MTISADANRLLRTAFPNRDGEVWIEWGHFDPHLKIDGRGMVAGINLSQVPDDAAVYYCCGLLKPGTSRSNENVERVYVLTIDDVGTKIDGNAMHMLAPAPTFIVRTSPGNYQWQYAIDGGLDPDTYVALRSSMKAHKVWGHSEAIAPSNLVRLPMGVNGKPGVVCDVMLTGAIGPVYADIVAAFGGLTVTVQQMKAAAVPLRAPNDLAVKALLARLPNTGTAPYCDSYQAWINFGLALYGATGGEGLDLWVEWSDQQPQAVDPAEKWGTFNDTKSGWDVLTMWEDREGSGPRGALAGALFDDGVEPPVDSGDNATIDWSTIKPWVMPDPTKIPRRPWLYGKRLIRGYLSSTIAAGGTGKSSLTMVEAVSMVTGKDLLGVGLDKMPRVPLNVMIWNGEDPKAELEMRFAGVCKHYGLVPADFKGNLSMLSGRQKPLRLGSGSAFNQKDIDWLKAVMKVAKVDVIMIDPFVSSHQVSENDNVAMDKVAKSWSLIAEECQCAVDLVHHIRKQGGGVPVDLTVDDARGASALVNASRYARVMSPMGKDAAKDFGIANRKAYMAIDHAATKANMVAGTTGVDWFRFVSVDLGNGDPFPADGGLPIPGDTVGVIERWVPSISIADDLANVRACQDEIAKGEYRANWQAKDDWVGAPIGQVLGLDPKIDRRMIENVIRDWVKKGHLKSVQKVDKTRHEREYIEVGTLASPPDF